jgi:hypothetical protein
MICQRRYPRLTIDRLMLVVSLAGLAGCGGGDPAGPGGPGNPENASPILSAIDDQAVALNTLAPRSLTVDLVIDDPDDDSFAVTVVSADEAVIPGVELACGGACELTLTPQATAATSVAVTVTATDDDGGEGSTGFVVHVAPTLVTTAIGDGSGSLRQVLADAEPGDVVGFDTNGDFGEPTTISLSNQLILGRDVTIDGPGAGDLSVSGDGTDRVFRIEEDVDVRLANLTVTGGVAPLESHGALGMVRLGGCLFVAPGGSLTLDGVAVTGCQAPADMGPGSGGGIANLDGTLVIRDSEIRGNVATSGCGGGIVNHGSLRIESSAIVGNEAEGDDGGGICNLGEPLTIVDSELRENVALDGGGVFSSTTGMSILDGTIVDGNRAIRGGGMFVAGEAEDWVLSGATVIGNLASSFEDSFGGGVYFAGDQLRILDSSRIENNATEESIGTGGVGGGVLFLGRDIEIIESVVSGNSSNTGGGLFVSPGVATGSANLRSARIEGNTARDAAGMHVGAGVLNVDDSVIARNAARGTGGGVRMYGVVAGFRASTIEENSASRGGGITVLAGDGGPNAVVEILDQSTVSNNDATETGGGLYLTGPGDGLHVTIAGSEVTDNSAPAGGGVYLSEGRLDVEGASGIRRNKADRGGGIHATDATLRFEDPSVAIANTAVEDGGGFYLVGTTLVVAGDQTCLILGNLADTQGTDTFHGGGIFHLGGSDISFVPANLVCLNSPDNIYP